eukprot:Skav229711  [mRNA]  locus=scaffold49:158968:159493:- [translate_table: standard]
MSPNGLWLRVPARGEGQDFRTLLRKVSSQVCLLARQLQESVKETACLGMTVPVRVTGIDQAKNRVLVSMTLVCSLMLKSTILAKILDPETGICRTFTQWSGPDIQLRIDP